MTIVITTNLADGVYDESFGIYNLMILVDYVNNNNKKRIIVFMPLGNIIILGVLN